MISGSGLASWAFDIHMGFWQFIYGGMLLLQLKSVIEGCFLKYAFSGRVVCGTPLRTYVSAKHVLAILNIAMPLKSGV